MKRILFPLAAALLIGHSARAAIISPLPYIFQNGTVADATQVNADLAQVVNQVNANAAPLANLPAAYVIPSIFGASTHVSSATYTTPTSGAGALPLYLEVRMWGAGGGGGGGGQTNPAGTAGTASTFSTFTANGGAGGAGTGGAGGTGGGGSCTVDIAGGKGGSNGYTGGQTLTGVSMAGGSGGGSYDFPPTFPPSTSGSQAGLGTTGGSGGAVTNNQSSTDRVGAGGGGGEYCFTIIATPAASYTYTVGTGGPGGAGGTDGGGGGAGGDGYLQVTARWQ